MRDDNEGFCDSTDRLFETSGWIDYGTKGYAI